MKRRRLIAATLLIALLPAAAAADRDPLEVPPRQYALVLAVAVLGGIVSWYGKVRSGHLRAWQIMHLVGELATSAFAGLLAYWLCELSGTPRLMSITLVGIAGHMGVRAISALEVWAQRHIGANGDH